MSDKKIKFVDGQMYEYEIYNFVDSYSDVLAQKTEPFDFNNPPVPPRYLAVSLIETMVQNRGIGLAANQVGLPYRVFVMGAQNVAFACFNPEILETEGEETVHEGCLSFPNLLLPVKRPEHVVAEFLDRNANTCIIRFDGIDARCFLHELDHLNGVCFTDNISKLKLDLAIKRQRKLNGRTKHRTTTSI